MRLPKIFSIAVPLIFTLLVAGTPNSWADVQPSADCKISNAGNPSPANEGWPRNPNLLPSLGSPKILVIPVDFPEAQFKKDPTYVVSGLMDFAGVEKFYREVSGGLFSPKFEIFPQYVTLSQPSNYYVDTQYVGNDSTSHVEDAQIIVEASQKVAKSLQLADYSAVVVVAMSGDKVADFVALARPGLSDPIITPTGHIHNVVFIGKAALQDPTIASYRIVVHEINHLLGLADLYLYEPNAYWKAKSTGGFGQMSYMKGDGAESLAWNRWLRGWIPDSQVSCFANQNQASLLTLQSGNSNGPLSKMAIIKLSDVSALVAEPTEDGILVYKVDASVPTGLGPVTIIPKVTPLTTAPLSPDLPDWVRFSEATLGRGDSVLFQNILIHSTEPKSAPYEIYIHIGADSSNLYQLLQNPLLIPAEPPVASQAAKAAKAYAESLKKAATAKQVKVVTCIKGKKTITIKSTAKCPIGYQRVVVSWSKS